jgi:MoaA/NifB/PqqE/SkfB family radical SAM enzyme
MAQSTLELILDGGPGFAQIAITNICNAKCDFCSFAVGKLKKSDFQSATFEGVRDACDILHEKGIRFITFTGGEPMVHPQFMEMVEYAGKKGLNPVVVTNGSMLDDDVCEDLAARGVQNVLISIDAPDEAVHDKNRGLPGLCKKIAKANAKLGELGITRTASVTVSKLVGDYSRLPRFLKGLGFDNLTFSYPLTSLHSTYLSFSSSSLIDYKDEELIQRFRDIQKLKSRFQIMNPSESLNEMIRFVKGEKSRYPCLAGHKYFFVDWKLDVYRCHYFPKPMCSIYDFAKAKS